MKEQHIAVAADNTISDVAVAVTPEPELETARKEKAKAAAVAHYEARLAKAAKPTYHADEHALMPTVMRATTKKETIKPIAHKDAVSVTIEDASDVVEVLVPEERPDKTMRGKLAVTDLAESQDEQVPLQTTKLAQAKEPTAEVAPATADDATHIPVSLGSFEHDDSAVRSELQKKDFTAKVAATPLVSEAERAAHGAKKAAAATGQRSTGGSFISPLITLSVVAGLACVGMVLGLSWQVDLDGVDADTSYQFNVSSVIEAH